MALAGADLLIENVPVPERAVAAEIKLTGGDVDLVHSADVPYEELLKHLFKLNAGYFQMEMASERDRRSAYKLVGKYLRDDAKGIPQIAYIGCIITQSPRPELAQEVCDQLVAAAFSSLRMTI